MQPMEFISGSMLENRIAIVSGIGPGMGRDLALSFAHQGADVVLAARTESKLDEVAAEVRSVGRKALCVPTDLMDESALDNLVSSTVAEFGRIDILVNNAFHGGDMTSLLDGELDTWRQTAEVNVWQTLSLTKRVADQMRSQEPRVLPSGPDGGRIVMINSMSAVRVEPKFGAYAASKAALAVAVKTLAGELGEFGIRVNGVHPGYIWGQSQEWYFNYLADQAGITFDEQYQLISEQTALGYLPHSSEIAATALYLVSDLALPVTGQAIHVNGGMHFGGF